MQRSLSTILALSLLAVAATAQGKDDPQITKGNRPGHYGPPPGTSFLQLFGGSDDCAIAATNPMPSLPNGGALPTPAPSAPFFGSARSM